MATRDSETAKTLFFEALALMDSSNFRDAELRLREALKLAPSQIAVLTNLSIALVQQNRRTEARAFAEQALATNPNSIEALLVLADCDVHGERFADAVAAYDRILAQEPGAAEIHNNRGNALHRLKRHDEALAAYEQALALSPDMVEAWLGRANVLFDLDRPDDALAAYDQTLALKGDLALAWLGRGNALSKLKRHGDALNDYERAATLQPDLPEAWLGRGNALCEVKRHDDSLAAFDKALALRPGLAAAWHGRGNVFYERKAFAEALAAYDRTVALDPDLVSAWVGRGDALRILKRAPEAIAAYQQALKLGADQTTIDFYLAGLGVGALPTTSPQQFVSNLFDSYADTFDRDLVENLKYRTPALLADAIRQHARSTGFDTLDLGCGTGLMGDQLRSMSRSMTGVDLSENMLEKARQRQIYDHLVCSDLTQFLQTQKEAFNLVVAADVFVYLGDLSSVFATVRQSLHSDGLFCFSVEATDQADFVLRSTMRYAHSTGYLRRLAQAHGFAVTSIESRIVRRDAGADIDGYLVMMRAA